jgi:hypothetical protein
MANFDFNAKPLMTRSDLQRAHQLIQGLTPDERAYFIACTDIFHDGQYNVMGRPSSSTQLQNTLTFNGSLTLTASNFPNLTPGARWDLNVISLPFLTGIQYCEAIDNGYFVTPLTDPPSTGGYLGGVTSFAADTATSNIFDTLDAPVSLNLNKFLYPQWVETASNQLIRPFYQVLSVGMECINATPDLYRGGTVIRYRVPTQGRAAILPMSNSFHNQFPRAVNEELFCYPLPPQSAQYASQFPDSVIDEAENGSYQMHTLQDQVSDYYIASGARVAMIRPQLGGEPATWNTLMSVSPWNGAYSNDPPLVRGDLDIVGSYFQGLDPNSVITIRYRAIISTVPSAADASLLSLAKMSPPMNAQLDELISLVQTDFLPGVRASMNPGGEWWGSVLTLVSKNASKVGKKLGGKTGQDIGQLVGDAVGLIPKGKKIKKKKKAVVKAQSKARPQTVTK